MSNPDWGRVLVTSQGSSGGPPLGDPTRWGAVVRQNVPAGLAGGTIYELESEQVIQVACTDRFARTWSLIGTLLANNLFWSAGNVGIEVASWICYARVRMGVAQATMLHNLNITALANAQDPFYFSPEISSLLPVPVLTKAFLAENALIGNNISIQFVNRFLLAAPLPEPAFFEMTMQIAPHAAGTGL